ncbi:MAG TPA: beta-galactosidase [Armatimonadota bacterium]|jgi:hypothetical protein
MDQSAIVGDRLLVKGEPFFMLAGEMHYFRLPADRWAERLAQARAGGLNTVTSYMPWYFHEPSEGAVDLTGATLPERNLRGFLDLAAEAGLYVVARPGPFVNSELRCGGLPEWLFRNHPETISRRADGLPATGRPALAEGEPTYRDYVRRWYRSVNALLQEYDINRGGPMIMFQPDNELSAGWTFGLLNSLYDPTVIRVLWPHWLQEQYGELARVATRHSRDYAAWAQIDPPRAFPTGPGEKLACLDWLNFKRWFFADWGATLAKWAREDGIQVPISFNEPVAGFYGHGDHAGFGSLLRDRGVEGTTALHTYSPPLVDLEGCAGIGQGVEITKSSPWGGPPMAVEINTSWFIPRLDRSAINWGSLLRQGLARGLQGWAIYVYTAGRVNLQDVIEGPEYFPGTCVDYDGETNQSYREVQRFYRFAAAWQQELQACQPAYDLTLGYTPGQRTLDFLGWPSLLQPGAASGGPGGEAFDAEPALRATESLGGHEWLGGVEGVTLQNTPPEAGVWRRVKEAGLTGVRLNYAWDMLELTNPNRVPGQGWLVIACTGTLERAAITYCLQHLDAGGGCLFFPTFPIMDEDGEPDLRLAERLGVRLTGQVRPSGGEILDYGSRPLTLADGGEVGVQGWIYTYEAPADAAVLASYRGAPVIVQAPATAGRVLVAGTDIIYTHAGTLDLWRRLLRDHLGVTPRVEGEGAYCHALLLAGEETSFLTVSNLTGVSGPSRLTVHGAGPGGGDVTLEVSLQPHESRCLALNAKLGAAPLVYATTEIIPLNAERTQVELHGAVGTVGKLAFAAPVAGVLDGVVVQTTPEGGLHVLSFRHGDEPSVLEIG